MPLQHGKNSGEKDVNVLDRRVTKNDPAMKNKHCNRSHHLSNSIKEKTEDVTWLLSQCWVFNFADKVITSSSGQVTYMLQGNMKSLSLKWLTAQSFSYSWRHTDSQSTTREKYPSGDTGEKAFAKW